MKTGRGSIQPPGRPPRACWTDRCLFQWEMRGRNVGVLITAGGCRSVWLGREGLCTS